MLHDDDNLDVLRRHIQGESVDLVFIDQRFNLYSGYTILFGDKGPAGRYPFRHAVATAPVPR